MYRKLTYIFIFFIVFLFPNLIKGQGILKKIKYQTEIGTVFSSSNQTPFWLRSNQYGIVPLESQFLTFKGSAHKEYDSLYTKNKKLQNFSYGYGVNMVANVGKVNQFLLPEAYVKLRFKAFELYGGRRKEIFGLVDTSLTSGSYIWSGNALPLPKIQISIPQFTSILGKGLISLKGNFAHAYFGNQGVVKDYYLHQKTFYGRVGKPNWKIKVYAGFNHQVVYGGTKEYIAVNGIKKYEIYPSNFQSYIWAVTGYSLNRVSEDKKEDQGLNDALNRVGNHLGSIDIAGEFNIKKIKILIYRQSIYDDGSLFYMNNISDGLNGISLTFNHSKNQNFRIKKIIFEYFNSTSQGGNKFGGEATVPQLRGGDNYFNNSFASWVYNQNIIGTPFFSTSEISNSQTDQLYIYNNFVKSSYFGTNASFKKTDFVLLVNSGKNLKSSINQFSSLLSISHPLKKYQIQLKLAYDKGQLLKNNLGFQLNCSRLF